MTRTLLISQILPEDYDLHISMTEKNERSHRPLQRNAGKDHVHHRPGRLKNVHRAMTLRILSEDPSESMTNSVQYGLVHLHQNESLLVNLKYRTCLREADVRDQHLDEGTRNVAVHHAVTVTALDAATRMNERRLIKERARDSRVDLDHRQKEKENIKERKIARAQFVQFQDASSMNCRNSPTRPRPTTNPYVTLFLQKTSSMEGGNIQSGITSTCPVT